MAYGRESNIGKRFGKLVVLRFVRTSPGSATYLCECDCGKVKEFLIGNLRQGKSKSCGCVRTEKTIRRSTVHGDRNTRLYSIWTNLKSRCNNPNSTSYKDYGRKGITVCPEWDEYESFKGWAIQNGYQEHLTIDRIDNSRGYSPFNCRWANYIEQSRNRDYAWFINIDGETKHAKEWCEENGLEYKTAHNRKRRGWSDIDAVTKPLQRHR